MQTRTSDKRPQIGSLQEHSQHPVVLLSRLHSAWCGYVAGLLLVGAAALLDRLYDYISSSSMFDTAPFGLVSIVVALLWGLRPALFAIAIGLIVIVKFITPPGLLTSNIGRDIAIFAPFVAMQLVAVGVAFRFEAA